MLNFKLSLVLLSLIAFSNSFNIFVLKKIKIKPINMDSYSDSFCIFPPFSLYNNTKNIYIPHPILFEKLVVENITTDDGEVPWFNQ